MTSEQIETLKSIIAAEKRDLFRSNFGVAEFDALSAAILELEQRQSVAERCAEIAERHLPTGSFATTHEGQGQRGIVSDIADAIRSEFGLERKG